MLLDLSFFDPASGDRMKAVFDAVPMAIFIKDSQSRILYVNKKCEEIWGVCLDDIAMSDASGFFPPGQMEKFIAKDKEVFDRGRTEEFVEVFWNSRLKKNRIGKTIKQPHYDQEGNPSYLVSVTEDITDQAMAEAASRRSQKVALVALADLAEYRDNDTSEHVLRVARTTHEVARRLKIGNRYPDEVSDEFFQWIGLASILHDIGKVGVADSVLLKPGLLTSDERAAIELHTITGGTILNKAEQMLGGSTHFKLAGEVAVGHHEFWNGGGYPHGLSGKDIPLGARIVAVSDVFDALLSRRPYKDPWPEEAAIAYIRERSGSQFDPLVVESFLEVVAERSRTETIEWTDKMSVHEASIDHDHKILLALVNQVQSPENREDAVAIEFVLDELQGYTISHFEREERLMAAVGYPGLAEHKKIHHDLVAEVEQRLQSFSYQDDIEKFGGDLSSFLSDWLINHIMHEDRKLIPYLTKSKD